jgi:ribosomal protein S18 acetylase RimI-like enzyme
MHLIEVHAPADMDTVRTLFREYEKWLDVDLCFQGFEQELASLPGDYAPPRGRILLAQDGDQIAGCVALRPLDGETCEMKRLFVREPYRGTGLGRRLVLACAETGRALGYARMRLDTLPKMQAAIGLYRALGFRDIPAYRPNPVPGALYLELPLDTVSGPK